MKAAIRLDDITPDMDWNKFNRIKNILTEAKLCPLIGVVPDNRDTMLHFENPKDDFFKQMKGLEGLGWKIAQHGCQHIYTTKSSGILKWNPFSEFAGESYDVQLHKLRVGKEILKKNGIATDIFMAPGHSYDKNTVKALKACGFHYVTDGFYKKSYQYKGLMFIPQRTGDISKAEGIDTVCIHANLMEEDDFIQFKQYLFANREKFVDFADFMKEKAVKKNFFITFCEKLTISEKKWKRKIGASRRADRYFKACESNKRVLEKIKRIILVPYLFYLVSGEKED